MTDNDAHVMTREEMLSVHEAFVRATEEQNIVLTPGKVWTGIEKNREVGE